MSLGTGALTVSGEGPADYKHRRKASMATRQAGTTQSLRAWRPEVPEGWATQNLRTPHGDSKHHQAHWLDIQPDYGKKEQKGLPVSAEMRAADGDTVGDT